MTQGEETQDGPELIFGLVGPMGSDMGRLSQVLVHELQDVGYRTSTVHVSQLFEHTIYWGPKDSECLDVKIEHLQGVGNELRQNSGLKDFSARLAIREIIRLRESLSGPDRPAQRHAYIVRQLKTPEEVDLLRKVYGQNFFLLGLYAGETERVDRLAEHIAKTYNQTRNVSDFRSQARVLIGRDDHELNNFGQNTRHTYPKADVFLRDNETIQTEVERFIRILFGHPEKTPRMAEHLMHQAGAAALRSSHRSRQVGAAIARYDGSVISLGTNEAPMAGGGATWEGDSPHKRICDYKDDEQYKRDAFCEVFERLAEAFPDQLSVTRDAFIESGLPAMKGTQFMASHEFERSVHAEMAALLDAARRGVSVEGAILWTTVFPCQNCAKHLIYAGIGSVVFMEPYPKSYTNQLYSAIFQERDLPGLTEQFEEFTSRADISLGAYIGVAPRRFREFFEMPKRRDRFGEATNWNKDRMKAMPRLAMRNEHLAYVPREEEEIQPIGTFLKAS